jgi:hypothetical protein
LQRFFNWLSRVPHGDVLGRKLVDVEDSDWTWERIGKETARHLSHEGRAHQLEEWSNALAREMQLTRETLPEPLVKNPYYFCFFPAGGMLARKALEAGIFDPKKRTAQTLDELSTVARRHLFTHDLYKIEKGERPIAA